MIDDPPPQWLLFFIYLLLLTPAVPTTSHCSLFNWWSIIFLPARSHLWKDTAAAGSLFTAKELRNGEVVKWKEHCLLLLLFIRFIFVDTVSFLLPAWVFRTPSVWSENNSLLTGCEPQSDALLCRRLALCQRQTVIKPKSLGKLPHVCRAAESCSVAAESSRIIREKQS